MPVSRILNCVAGIITLVTLTAPAPAADTTVRLDVAAGEHDRSRTPVSIETISSRDRFWFHHVVGLRYETTRAQLRAVVDGIVRQLGGHPAVDAESIRAKFFRFGPSSLDIEVVAYVVARDWAHFMDIQQEVLLGIMEVVEGADTAIALPSHTLHFAGTSPMAAAVLHQAGSGLDGT